MARVEIYTKSWCPYCGFAKTYLEDKGIAFLEIDVTHDDVLEHEMRQRSGRNTVPQVFVDGRHIGGSTELVAADNAGLLDELPRARDPEATS